MQALLEKPFFLPNEGRDPNCPIRPLYQKLSGHDAPFKDLKDDSLILTLVEQDVGISIMPGLLLENVAKGRRIRAIPLEPGAYRTVGILSKRNDDCADCTKAFVQAAREHLSVWQPRLDWQGEAPQSSQIPS